MNRIYIKNLSFSYPNISIFNNINLNIDTVGFYAILGKSGIGKSTLAKILIGVEKIYTADEMIIPTKILYCTDKESLPKWQTTIAHLKSVIPIDKNDLLNTLLEKFNIDSRIQNLKINQLSAGELNRINIIRYLLQDYDLLIIDEGLNNIDEMTKHVIISTIKKVFLDKMYLYISHHLLEIFTYSKEIVYMERKSNHTDVETIKGLNCISLNENKLDMIYDFISSKIY
jgi:ABC-type multidrug transport system ATPase subunit